MALCPFIDEMRHLLVDVKNYRMMIMRKSGRWSRLGLLMPFSDGVAISSAGFFSIHFFPF